MVECATDGSTVDVARALAGRPAVLNLWAYWCAPCAVELPAMAEYQRRAGGGVSVVTVHQDENEAAALADWRTSVCGCPPCRTVSVASPPHSGAQRDARDGGSAGGR